MPRTNPQVVRVEPADLPRFVAIWIESRVAAGQSAEWADRAAREGRVEQALAREDVRAYLAVADDEILGFAVVTASPLSGMVEDPAVWVDQLYVRPQARKQGIGKLLLAQVSRYADHRGATHVVSYMPTKDREANRYLARLGFGSTVTTRIVASAALRRKVIAAEAVESRTVRHRRSLRARAGI